MEYQTEVEIKIGALSHRFWLSLIYDVDGVPQRVRVHRTLLSHRAEGPSWPVSTIWDVIPYHMSHQLDHAMLEAWNKAHGLVLQKVGA